MRLTDMLFPLTHRRCEPYVTGKRTEIIPLEAQKTGLREPMWTLPSPRSYSEFPHNAPDPLFKANHFAERHRVLNFVLVNVDPNGTPNADFEASTWVS